MKTVEQIEEHLKIIREQKQYMTAESKKPGITPDHAQKLLEIAQLRSNEEFMLLWVLDREAEFPPIWGTASGGV